jgi:hypothetical protein
MERFKTDGYYYDTKTLRTLFGAQIKNQYNV